MLHAFLHSLINHFVPHDGNDYRPHLLQRAGVVGMLLLIVLSFTMANFQAFLWQTSDWLVGAVLPAVVVELTNVERTEAALVPLQRSAILDAAATLKAQDMAKNSYFSHDSPTGVTPWHWFSEAGYPFVHAGENLAVYFTDSDEVVEAWMASPTHRANIVGSQYREIGVGTARGMYDGYETVFVVQLFGTPAIPPAAVATPVAVAIPAPAVPVADPIELALAQQTEVIPPIPASEATLQPIVAGEATDVPEVPPEPPAETVASEVSSTTPVLAAGSAPAVPVDIIETEVTDEYVSLYLGLAASSTDLLPLSLSAQQMSAGTTAPLAARLATQPHTVLQYVYIFVGLITSLALLASVILQWRQHRPLQTVYGLVLLVIMCGLFYMHSIVTAGALVA